MRHPRPPRISARRPFARPGTLRTPAHWCTNGAPFAHRRISAPPPARTHCTAASSAHRPCTHLTRLGEPELASAASVPPRPLPNGAPIAPPYTECCLVTHIVCPPVPFLRARCRWARPWAAGRSKTPLSPRSSPRRTLVWTSRRRGSSTARPLHRRTSRAPTGSIRRQRRRRRRPSARQAAQRAMRCARAGRVGHRSSGARLVSAQLRVAAARMVAARLRKAVVCGGAAKMRACVACQRATGDRRSAIAARRCALDERAAHERPCLCRAGPPTHGVWRRQPPLASAAAGNIAATAMATGTAR